jgi:hypothetical protein
MTMTTNPNPNPSPNTQAFAVLLVQVSALAPVLEPAHTHTENTKSLSQTSPLHLTHSNIPTQTHSHPSAHVVHSQPKTRKTNKRTNKSCVESLRILGARNVSKQSGTGARGRVREGVLKRAVRLLISAYNHIHPQTHGKKKKKKEKRK